MSKPDWQCAKNYEFTEKLNSAGWAWEFLRRNPMYVQDWLVATQQQKMFMEFQAGKIADARNNPYIIFEPPLPAGESPARWAKSEGVTWCGPMKSYGRKWRLNGHMHDPASCTPPHFEPIASARLLEWEELGKYYNAVAEYSDIQHQTSHVAVVGIDLSRAFHSIENDLEKIITDEKKRRGVKNISQLHLSKRSNWQTYIRILDARREGATTLEIGILLLPEKDKISASVTIDRYIKRKIADLLTPDGYIRIANTPM